MSPTPPNNASVNPRPEPDPYWCERCNKKIVSHAAWENNRPYHTWCLPVARAEFDRLENRVAALECKATGSWRKTDTDT